MFCSKLSIEIKMSFLIYMENQAPVYLFTFCTVQWGSHEVSVPRALTTIWIWLCASELGTQCITAFEFNGSPDGGQPLESPAKRNWLLWRVLDWASRVCVCVRVLHTPAWTKVSLIGIVTVGPRPLSLSQNTLIHLPVPEPFSEWCSSLMKHDGCGAKEGRYRETCSFDWSCELVGW